MRWPYWFVSGSEVLAMLCTVSNQPAFTDLSPMLFGTAMAFLSMGQRTRRKSVMLGVCRQRLEMVIAWKVAWRC